MTYRVIPVDPFDYIVFGGTGDLSRRKLLPALFHRLVDGQIPTSSRIIGASRSKMTSDEFRAVTRQALETFVRPEDREAEMVETFLSMVHYISVDATTNSGWSDLVDLLGTSPNRIRAFYLAVGPSLFASFCEQLAREGLVTETSRLVIEKPIGHDLASAIEVNEAVGAVFSESQVFRIDHFLGKETVQNLMALRFGNALYEPLWNSAHIDHVQISVAETIGVGSRGGYYDKSGALKDMVQNHILQLLCLVAMEPPESLDADSVRDEKLKVLRALNPIDHTNAQTLTVRGQYKAGASDGEAVPGYLQELEADESATETFVAVKAEIGNWRWAGVPFYLRTGKRLAEKVSEITITFRDIPHSIFPAGSGIVRSNRLVIRLQPDEGVKQWIMIKDPGPGGMRLRYVPLDMSFAESFAIRHPDAYERLLLDVIRGNQTLFMRRDEVEAAWAWTDPITDAWASLGMMPNNYTAGTWGPSSSIALIERDGRTWYEDADQ